jgi:hypothetical protein
MLRQAKAAGAVALISSLCLVGISTLLMRMIFRGSPPPDFTNIYLLFVLGLAYRGPWRLAAALAAATLGVSAYLLAPLDSTDAFQLISYAVCASVIVWVMATLRRGARTTS